MNNQCNSSIPTCKCNYTGNTPNFDSNNLKRPNLGSIELDYDVEMPTNFIQGLNGKSAYEYAVKGGYQYSECQFYKDLAGVGGIEAPELHLLADSIKLGESITVFTGDDEVTIGGYRNGDVIPASATLLDILKGLFTKVIEYIYTDPTVYTELIPTDSTFVNEVVPVMGDPIYLLLRMGYIRGDAGFINAIRAVNDSTVLYNVNDPDLLRQLNRIGVSDVTKVDLERGNQEFRIPTGISYSGTFNCMITTEYNGGAIHSNTSGEVSPGAILPGSVAQPFVFNPIYPVMYRCSEFPFTTDNLISNVSNRNIYPRVAPVDGTCKFRVSEGVRSVAIAIPSVRDASGLTPCSVRDIIFDKLSAGMDTVSSFTKITSVDGVPITFMGTEYSVYYLDLDLPISAVDECTVILNVNQ